MATELYHSITIAAQMTRNTDDIFLQQNQQDI